MRGWFLRFCFWARVQISPRRSWIKEEGGGLETAIVEMQLSRPVFSEGRLSLRCAASLYNLFNAVTEQPVYLIDHEVSPWPPASVRHSDTANLAGELREKRMHKLSTRIFRLDFPYELITKYSSITYSCGRVQTWAELFFLFFLTHALKRLLNKSLLYSAACWAAWRVTFCSFLK